MATDPKKPAARPVELPAATAEGEAVAYVPPADATAEEIASMIEDARVKANELLADDADPATADDRISEVERYLGAIEALEARGAEIQTETAEREQRLADIRAKLTPAEKAEAAEAAPGATEDEDDEATKKAKAAKAEADAAENGGTTVNGDVSDPSINAAGEPLLVASGQATLHPVRDAGIAVPTRRSAVAAAASAGSAPTLPEDGGRADLGRSFLVAAAGIRGLQAGAEITWDNLGESALHQFKALPEPRPGRTNAGRTQLHIGSVVMDTADTSLVADGSGGKAKGEFVEANAAMEWAVSRDRLLRDGRRAPEDGETSLVAAGGWCAPSETLYDLLDITTDDGMLDTPGIVVTRGGVRYSLGPDFTAVYVTGNANFTRTEAQAIAGSPTKPMVNIPCPSFTDNRMVVDGLYLTGDILSAKGYPEAYTDYTQKAMKAFAHFVNAASIADQVTLSTAVDLSAATGTPPVTNRSGSAVTEVLGAVELQITDMRYKNRLSMTQAVEVVAPFWIKGVLRTDIAKRQGVENAQKVSDADITEWFSDRGASVQFVYDWQDAFTGVSSGFGAASAIAGWPLTAKFLIYPQGTFVRALDPVIELNAVYDSTLLQTNQYVALFMEQGRLTLKRHWDARVVTVDVHAYGATTAGTAVGAPAGTLTGSTL